MMMSYRKPYEREPKELEQAVYWPYRTTPLVLPGAKIKKDAPLGECYLRHHPNPAMRAGPHHYDIANPEVAMKQKVVSKQFNSPIGLYSEQNIADTLKCQASAIPKRPGKFDPNLSETYKVLQEEAEERIHEIRQANSGFFSPHQARQHRAQQQNVRPKSPGYSPFINVADQDGDKIHQSNSFRRVMFSVLGETEY